MTVKKTVRLSEATDRMVTDTAARTGTTETDVMAEAIDRYLMQQACADLDRWATQADHDALIERWRAEDATE